MDVIVMKKYLPDTALNAKHSSAAALKRLLDGVAAEKGGEIALFEVSRGEAMFQVKNDTAFQAVLEEVKLLKEVEVSTLSALEAQLHKNKRMQEKAVKMRETRGSKKNA